MVHILDGNSLRGAHVRRNICYSTSSRYLITSRAVTNRVFLPEKTHFLHACATCNEIPSNISTMGHSGSWKQLFRLRRTEVRKNIKLVITSSVKKILAYLLCLPCLKKGFRDPCFCFISV